MATKQRLVDGDLVVSGLVDAVEGADDADSFTSTILEKSVVTSEIAKATIDDFISDIITDGIIDPTEKRAVLGRWQDIDAEYSPVRQRALDAGLLTTDTPVTAYATAKTALHDYLWTSPGILINMTESTSITPSAMKAVFDDYQTALQAIQDATEKKLADDAESDATTESTKYGYGINILPCSDFPGAGLTGSAAGGDIWDASNLDSYGKNLSAYWALQGNVDANNTKSLNAIWFRQLLVSGGAAFAFSILPVTAGKKYIASVYSGAHRCQVSIGVIGYDSSGASTGWLTIGVSQAINNVESWGGASIEDWKRIYEVFTVPSGTTQARVILCKNPTISGMGYSDSYALFTRAMLEEANEHATLPGAWAPYAAGYSAESISAVLGMLDKVTVTSGTNIVKSDYTLIEDRYYTNYGVNSYKSKQICVPGTYRVRFEYEQVTEGFGPVYAAVYKNATPGSSGTGTRVGTEHQYPAYTTGLIMESQDIAFDAGDLIQVGTKSIGSSYVRIVTFEICIAESPGILKYLGSP